MRFIRIGSVSSNLVTTTLEEWIGTPSSLLSAFEEVAPSKVSLMPTGLLDKLNRDEVLDLLAYLLSRGNPNDQIFQK